MSVATYPHIEIRPDGTAVIANTGMKVILLVLEQMAYDWDAEELQRQHPHLTLGQIHSALAYYHDHVDDFNAAIEERLRLEKDLLARFSDPVLRAKLQAAKHRS